MEIVDRKALVPKLGNGVGEEFRMRFRPVVY